MTKTAVAMLLLGLGGCAVRGAPEYILFGAYFPAWMFCAVLGILGGIAARAGMVATGLSELLPHQLFICVSVGVMAAVTASLLWFGP
jgi:hypothetical protein